MKLLSIVTFIQRCEAKLKFNYNLITLVMHSIKLSLYCIVFVLIFYNMANAFTKEQFEVTLENCCFPDKSKKLLLFRQPITVVIFNLSHLDESDVELIKITVDSLREESGINIQLMNSRDFETQTVNGLNLKSSIFIFALPNELKELDNNSKELLSEKFNGFAKNRPGQLDLISVIKKVYTPGSWFWQAQISTQEFLVSALVIVKMSTANILADKTIEISILAAMQYNREMKPLAGTIFSKESNTLTYLDLSVIHSLYRDDTVYSTQFDEAARQKK